MHFPFNFDACPVHLPFGFVHLTHQNLSASALFCHNSLAEVNIQLLIYNHCFSTFFPPIVENPNHCEFSNLRDMLIRTHLQDLKDVTHSIHYENFRYERLQARQKYEKADESRC